MTDEEKSRELTRSSFAAQMAMLGYEPNGNPKDMVEVVRCKDCEHWYADDHECNIKAGWFACGADWFCADGERRETQ